MPTIFKPKKINKPVGEYKRSNNSAQYYNSRRWKYLRHRYITDHPFCEICEKRGRAVNADEVHHKHFILNGLSEEERYMLLTDENNLMSLCSSCHHKLHAYAKSKMLSYCDDYPEDFKNPYNYV